MAKKVLAIYYSQSGQLADIIDHFTNSFHEEGIILEKVKINLKKDFEFPWTTDRFFSVMPDSVLGMTMELAPFELKESRYDLIILGYQAWFLSPSIPINSLLQNKNFKTILKNTPVITITGARNMWLNAFLRVKKMLKTAEAKLVGNIALVDKHPNFISFVTIFHWMIHGKKDRYLNIFPLPGVSDTDIQHTQVLGNLVIPHLENNDWRGLQLAIDKNKGVEFSYNLMIIESTAGKIFSFWAKFIVQRKNKKFWLKVFKYYLLVALFIGAPFLLVFNTLFFRYFFKKRKIEKKEYFLTLN
ncbi:MAG: hypothetical protein ACYCOO_11560 [Chitinophagaceae bacterium]